KSQAKKPRPKAKPKKRSFGIIKFLVILPFIAAIVFLAYRYQKNPQGQFYPYPYTVEGQIPAEELKRLSEAQVLMIGDRLTLSLEKYRDVFVQAASKNITE